MKNYREIADAVFRKRDEYKASRRRLVKRLSAVLCCVLVFAVLGTVSVLLSTLRSSPSVPPELPAVTTLPPQSLEHSTSTTAGDSVTTDFVSESITVSEEPAESREETSKESHSEAQTAQTIQTDEDITETEHRPPAEITEAVTDPPPVTDDVTSFEPEASFPTEEPTEDGILLPEPPMHEYEYPFFENFQWKSVNGTGVTYEIVMDLSSDGAFYFTDGSSLPVKLPLFVLDEGVTTATPEELLLEFATLLYGSADESRVTAENGKVLYFADDELLDGEGIVCTADTADPFMYFDICLKDSEVLGAYSAKEALDYITDLPYYSAAMEYLGISDTLTKTMIHYKEGRAYAYSYSFSQNSDDLAESEKNYYSGGLSVRYVFDGDDGAVSLSWKIEGPCKYRSVGEYSYVSYENAVEEKLDSLKSDPNYEYYKENIIGKIAYMETHLPDGTVQLAPLYDFYYKFTDAEGNIKVGKPYSWDLEDDNSILTNKLPWPLDFMN